MMVEFLREHHVMTVAVSAADDIWCSHAFYVFLEDENAFLIISEEKTRHIKNSKKKILLFPVGLLWKLKK